MFMMRMHCHNTTASSSRRSWQVSSCGACCIMYRWWWRWWCCCSWGHDAAWYRRRQRLGYHGRRDSCWWRRGRPAAQIALIRPVHTSSLQCVIDSSWFSGTPLVLLQRTAAATRSPQMAAWAADCHPMRTQAASSGQQQARWWVLRSVRRMRRLRAWATTQHDSQRQTAACAHQGRAQTPAHPSQIT
jgi:hypothetical protein